VRKHSEVEKEPAELDWDSEIPVDEGRGEFVTLPEGTVCEFRVVRLEKDRSSTGHPMARLELICTAQDGQRSYVRENLTLSPAALWRARKFGIAIGQLAPNEPGRIDWDHLDGTTGCCRLGVETWTRRDGEEAESNKVKDWLPPEGGAAAKNSAQEEVSFA
jgi:hypothetical protein